MTPATRFVIGLALGVVCADAAGIVAMRQDPATGEIAGAVTDTGRSAIPGATITLDGRRLQAPRTIKSDMSGQFRFTGVPAGGYFLRFQLAGFKIATRESIAVTAGGNANVNVSLEILGLVQQTETGPARLPLRDGEVGVGLKTTDGDIYVAVDTVRAPVTSANFLKYVDGGFYNLGRFHRVTRPDNYTPAPPNRPPMEIIQAGADPLRFREAFPPIALERTSVTGLKHIAGALSMARGGPDTATSDFVILLDDQPSLDFGGKRFDDGQGGAAFGRVLIGMDVVRKIQQERPMRADNPQYLQNPLVIISAHRFSK